MNIYTISVISWLIVATIIGRSRGFLGSINRIEKKKRLILLSFVIIFGSIMAFRGRDVGTDTWLYSNIFVESGISGNVFKYYLFPKAPIYVLACKLLYFFSHSPNTMIIVSSYITVGAFSYFIYKKSEDVVLSAYLFLVLDYYLYAFNASRQLLAMSILLIAYLRLEAGDKKKGIIIWLIACGVHNLALVFAPIIVLYFIRLNRNRFHIICISTLAVEIMAMKLLGVVQGFMHQYSDLSSMGYSLGTGDSSGGRIVYAIIFLGIEIISFILAGRRNNWIYEEELLRLLIIINVGLFSMIIYRHFYVFVRVEKIFCQFLILYLPIAYKHLFKKTNRAIARIAAYGVFFIPFIMQSEKYLPYYLWGNV